MGLALDEPKEEDLVFETDDMQVLADSRLRTEIIAAGGLMVDLVDHPVLGKGFNVKLTGASECC